MSAHRHLQLHSVGWLDSCWLESCWKFTRASTVGRRPLTLWVTTEHFTPIVINIIFLSKIKLSFTSPYVSWPPKTPVRLFPPHALIQAGPTLLKNTSVVWGKLIWVSQFLRLVLALWLTSHSFHSLLPKRTRIYWNDFSVSKLVSIVTLWGFVFLKKRWFKVCCQSRLGN